jgi:hypothetical protein
VTDGDGLRLNKGGKNWVRQLLQPCSAQGTLGSVHGSLPWQNKSTRKSPRYIQRFPSGFVEPWDETRHRSRTRCSGLEVRRNSDQL